MATSPQVAVPAPAAGGSKKMLIGIVGAVVLLAAGGGGAFMFLGKKHAAEEEAAPKAVVAEKPIFVTLEPLTINLQTEGRPRFLHIGMALKVTNEKSKEQIVEFMPELRSRLLMLLSNRQGDSLVSPEGKSKLADEIRTALNEPLGQHQPSPGIASVSFNTFVVQ